MNAHRSTWSVFLIVIYYTVNSHKVVETVTFSRKTGQIPYVIYNGEELTDSAAIMDFFNEERGDLDAKDGLTDEQRGASTAIIAMVGELLSWLVGFEWSLIRCFQMVLWP